LCKECDRERNRKFYQSLRGHEYKSTYRKLTASEQVKYQRVYREANKKYLVEQRKQNREHKKELDRSYQERFPDKVAAKASRRRVIKKSAEPVWANRKYIDLFFRMAKDEKIRTSREVHVDHIVPLKSDKVCGLHCEDNLQLLFKEDNISKGNRRWPDMWE
jgi:hypothetical protein